MIAAEYEALVGAITERVADIVPPGCTVLVVGRGDDLLLDRLPRECWQFPLGPDGGWAGYHPSGDAAAIAHLASLRARGADFLVVPGTSLWWLDHYRGLSGHLDSLHLRVADDERCVAFDLRAAAPHASWSDVLADDVLRRCGRRPTVVDWDSSIDVALYFPRCAVLSRPRGDGRLPDLDGTADVVVLQDGDADRAAEARRVASRAVIAVPRDPSRPPRVDRLRRPAVRVRPPVLVAACGETAPRRLQVLCETFPGNVVAVVDSVSAAAEAHAVAAHDAGIRVLEVDAPARVGRALGRVLADVDADVVALASADTLPLPGWWRAALRTLAERPDAGAVAAAMRTFDGEPVAGSPGLVRPVADVSSGLLVARRPVLERAAAGGGGARSDEDALLALGGRIEALGLAVYEDPDVEAVRTGARAGPARTERTSAAGASPRRRRTAAVLVERLDGSAESEGRMPEHAVALADAGWDVTLVALENRVPPWVGQRLADRGVEIGAPPARIEDILATRRIDVVLLEGAHMAGALTAIRSTAPAMRVVVDCAGLDVPPGGLGAAAWGDDPRRAEHARGLDADVRVHAAADVVLVSCERDAALLRELCAGATPVHAIRCRGAVPARGALFADRRGIVFAGRREPADVAGLRWLCRELVPRLGEDALAAHPLHVVGRGLSAYLPAGVRSAPDVRVAGDVPSLVPYLARARVAVCPPPAPPGVRPVLAAAVAAGLPVVAPHRVAEDLGLRDGQGVVVAEDPASFARATGLLLSDGGAWQRVARAGRAAARRAARDCGDHICDVFAAALERAPKRDRLAPEDLERARWRRTHDASRCVAGPIRETLDRLLPADATVAVFSDGSAELVGIPPRPAWHFPQDGHGAHRRLTPDDPGELLGHLDDIHRRGADHVLVPAPQRWWLHYYPELNEHLRTCHRVLVDDEHCLLVALAGAPARGGRFVGARPGATPADPPARLIAFYLPQFHPLPENDAWWGRGFTEWTNVRRAEPLFTGHEQPHVPGELGYYDLRLAGTRHAQADLARAHGIQAFCYYHYWFQGQRLLERPFAEVLASGQPNFPFCLCWANESWSRRWDGGCEDILQAQGYSHEDDVAHIEWLLPALADPRAITVEGRPLFLVYRARSLPDPARTVTTWRRAAHRAGLPGLHLVAVETARDAGWDATRFGFDAKLHFAPQFRLLAPVDQTAIDGPAGTLRVYDYERAWPVLANPEPVDYLRYDTVCPRWDNTPRVGERGLVLHGSSPEAYETWLTLALVRAVRRPAERRLVFINAWNEWGEGCHLEPDAAHSLAYLDATRRALGSVRDRGRALFAGMHEGDTAIPPLGVRS